MQFTKRIITITLPSKITNDDGTPKEYLFCTITDTKYDTLKVNCKASVAHEIKAITSIEHAQLVNLNYSILKFDDGTYKSSFWLNGLSAGN